MWMHKFEKGAIKTYFKTVTMDDLARFESGTVHEVYATFALARDAEWSGRLFVLEMKEEDEEGIGTQIEVKHISPALLGASLKFESVFEGISEKGEILTSFKIFCEQRLIAKGTQTQRILKKEKIEKLFAAIGKVN
jgi:predicted thioesterase